MRASEARDKQHHSPPDETSSRQNHHQHQPKPQEEQHHGVVEVHGKGALKGVAVHIAQNPLHHVAVGDSREALRHRPTLIVNHSAHHRQAVVVVVIVQKVVQVVELTESIGEVDALDKDVQER